MINSPLRIKRPFVRYYGAKFRLRKKYPRPRMLTIIEPFAGLAGYSTLYPQRKVILYDVNSDLIQMWEYLINVSEEEFLRLPTNWHHISEVKNTPEEGILYLRWVCNSGTPILHNVLSMFTKDLWNDVGKSQLASQLKHIRHWKVFHKSWQDIDIDRKATWFVDAPYNNKAGSNYPYSKIDYSCLALWCKSLNSQCIVCENIGATWLPFHYLCDQKGAAVNRKLSQEAIWHSFRGNVQ